MPHPDIHCLLGALAVHVIAHLLVIYCRLQSQRPRDVGLRSHPFLPSRPPGRRGRLVDDLSDRRRIKRRLTRAYGRPGGSSIVRHRIRSRSKNCAGSCGRTGGWGKMLDVRAMSLSGRHGSGVISFGARRRWRFLDGVGLSDRSVGAVGEHFVILRAW